MKVLTIGGRLGAAAVDFIMPPLCVACGTRTAEPRHLCASCWSELAFIEKPHCPLWGEPFAFDAGAGTFSARAIANPPPWTSLTAAVAFNDRASRLVHALKYHDRLETAALMVRLMHRAVKGSLAGDELFIPVPLHWLRQWRRRYNQAALLSRALSLLSGNEHLPRALLRRRATRTQVGLERREREANMRGAFAVSDTALAAISGRRVVLIDDVLTTGATAAAAARTLFDGGARQVNVLVFALVLLPGQSHI